MAIKFFKDWLVQKSNTYLIDGIPKILTRDFGTVYQEGDKDKADYFNEIQKNCVYSVNATRVVEGVVEIYDISLTGSDVFPLFNTQFLVDFNETNTKVDPVLRWNGKTYAIRKNYKFDSRQFEIGEIRKRNLMVLDQTNSIALVNEFINEEYTEEITCLTATGSYIIPAGLPVGAKKLYRKVNATQGTVTISASGSEKITTGLLNSVTLNGDGDFWLLEKITDTRWNIIDGYSSGSDSSTYYKRFSNGLQYLGKIDSTPRAMASNGYYDYIFDWSAMNAPFKYPNYVTKGNAQPSVTGDYFGFVYTVEETLNSVKLVFKNGATAQNIGNIKIELIGVWY